MFTGPNTITDGLVLALDAGNTKSFRGEPTTNYLSNGISNHNIVSGNSWLGYTPSTVGNSEFETPIKRYVTTGTSYMYSRDEVLDDDLAILSSKTVTFSLYIKRLEGPSSARIRIYDNVSGYSYYNINTTTEFQRFSGTKILGSNPTRIFVMIDITGGGTYDIHSPQLEAKAYATPFVNGTRGTTVATGGGLADKSGNNNHGELVNGPTFDSGNGGSIVFDGVNDYLSIDTTNLNNLTEGSVEFWFQSPNTGPIFNFFTDVNNYFTIWTGDSTGFWIDESIRIIYRKGGTYYYNYAAREGNSYYADNNWHHCVFTVDSSGNNLYTNGSLLTVEQWSLSTEGNTSSRWFNDLSPDNITFGRRIDNYTNVGISSAKIYNKALTPEEILQNYNATKSRFNL